MSLIDPAGRLDPAPVSAPSERQTTPASGGETKPDANQAELPGLTADPNEQTPPDDAGAEKEREERRERRRNPAQERINELTADKRRLEREKDQLLERVLNGGQQPNGQQRPASEGELKEPREADFADYGEYLKARDNFLVERTRRTTAKEYEDRQAAEKRKGSEEQMRVRASEARQRFDQAADSVATSYEDFDDVMDRLWDGKIPVVANNDAVAEFIIEHAERGPELVYFLDANPKEAKRIAALTSPIAVARELTRLEQALPKPTARTVSKAPPPPKEVKGGGADKQDPEKMSIDDMRKAGGFKRKVDY